jgi:poly-gamma-glutamate synthesis protein (capsule biosynthesis protein)
MIEDIRNLRPQCDILIVSLHKGIVHVPIKLAAYEQQVSYAAIDAGADLVVGHHAHILKGIEVYKGKVIFHGLCNLVNYRPGLAPRANEDPNSWVRRRREIFGFEPDPEYPTYPFHPEAINTIIGKCLIKDKKIVQTSYLPCLVNKQGQPEVLKRDARGEKVFEYMNKITKEAGLNAKYEWKDDEVLVYSD